MAAIHHPAEPYPYHHRRLQQIAAAQVEFDKIDRRRIPSGSASIRDTTRSLPLLQRKSSTNATAAIKPHAHHLSPFHHSSQLPYPSLASLPFSAPPPVIIASLTNDHPRHCCTWTTSSELFRFVPFANQFLHPAARRVLETPLCRRMSFFSSSSFFEAVCAPSAGGLLKYRQLPFSDHSVGSTFVTPSALDVSTTCSRSPLKALMTAAICI